jgi:hypothetical protein
MSMTTGGRYGFPGCPKNDIMRLAATNTRHLIELTARKQPQTRPAGRKLRKNAR